MPAPLPASASRHTGLTALLKALHWKMKHALYFVFVFMHRYYLCEKYNKPISVQYHVADHVSWGSGPTCLDLTNQVKLRTCSRNGARLYVEDTMY